VLTGRSIYTVEAHINYLREVKEGAKLNFVTHILNFDSRRIHLFHTMYTDSNDQAIATTELMELHVDEQPRVSNMPEEILRKVREVFENHRELEIPSNVGRRINIGG
jgi:acyl-CoA thioester hydrolase